ncbi:MAG: exo-alpha-sialidase [Acidobacteria bacterium]|nr:exo-alpha-sialidase [Acidobacteriota bacterium]
MRKALQIFVILSLALLFVMCEDRTSEVPEIVSLQPSLLVTNMPGFDLVVKGSGFTQKSVVYFNGVARETAFLNSEELVVSIPHEAITDDAVENLTIDENGYIYVPVYVHTPIPGGGDSTILAFSLQQKFTLTEPEQLPITQMDNSNPQIYSRAGGGLYILTNAIDETNFVAYSTVSTNYGDTLTSTQIVEEFLSTLGYGIKNWLSWDFNSIYYHTYLYYFEGNYSIYGRVSDDAAVSFDASFFEPISSEYEIKDFRSLNYGSENIFTVWSIYDADGVGVIQFNVTRDQGNSYSDTIQINQRPLASPYVVFEIDKNTGKIIISWVAKNEDTGIEGIYTSESNDYGKTFSAPVSIITGNSASVHIRKPVGYLSSDGLMYYAWWEWNGIDTSSMKVRIAKPDESGTAYTYHDVTSFNGFNENTAPLLQMVVDNADSVYFLLQDSDATFHFLRSTDGLNTFTTFADSQTFTDHIGDFAMTLDEYGKPMLVYMKSVEYEDEDTDGNTITFSNIEPFFVKTNE